MCTGFLIDAEVLADDHALVLPKRKSIDKRKIIRVPWVKTVPVDQVAVVHANHTPARLICFETIRMPCRIGVATILTDCRIGSTTTVQFLLTKLDAFLTRWQRKKCRCVRFVSAVSLSLRINKEEGGKEKKNRQL